MAPDDEDEELNILRTKALLLGFQAYNNSESGGNDWTINLPGKPLFIISIEVGRRRYLSEIECLKEGIRLIAGGVPLHPHLEK